MSHNFPCRRSHRRYVQLILEELEGRYVPSHFGVQVELPLSGLLSPQSISVGTGAAPISALTITVTTTTLSSTTPTGSSTTPSTLGPGSMSFSQGTPGSNPSSAPAAGSGEAASQPSAPASNTGGAGVGSPGSSSAFSGFTGSSSAFSGGAAQGSGSTFALQGSASTGSVSGLAIQTASPANASTVLGGATQGVNIELLGNLSWLMGNANAQLGSSNAAISNSSLAGSPLAGSLFYRPDLFTGPTTGARGAFGLSHPAPGDREELVPEQLLIPPDEQWFQPLPQKIEQTIPVGNFPAGLRNAPPAGAVNAQLPEVPAADLPDDFFFSDEDMGLPADDEQPEEVDYSAMSAAVAIISAGAGAYWTIRDRRTRKSITDSSLRIEEVIR